MEELFTDVPEDVVGSEPTVSPVPQESSDSDIQDSGQADPAVSTGSVQAEQDPLDQQADTGSDTSVSSDKDFSEGVETLQDSATVGTVDYTDLLKEQNEHLQSLISETRQCRQELENIQNAMPGMMCALGLVIGLLLLQILASYLRP